MREDSAPDRTLAPRCRAHRHKLWEIDDATPKPVQLGYAFDEERISFYIRKIEVRGAPVAPADRLSPRLHTSPWLVARLLPRPGAAFGARLHLLSP